LIEGKVNILQRRKFCKVLRDAAVELILRKVQRVQVLFGP